MINRINLLLKAKNISARQFAEEIGIQPSGMSHILSGRNNPSLDFVMKVMTRWPEININWLMFGKGEMYVPQYPTSTEQENTPPPSDNDSQNKNIEYDLFSQPISEITNRVVIDDKSDTPNPHNQIKKGGQHINSTIDTVPVIKEERFHDEAKLMQQDEPKVNEIDVKQAKQKAECVQANVVHKKIEKIVLFFTDHTFSEYFPE